MFEIRRTSGFWLISQRWQTSSLSVNGTAVQERRGKRLHSLFRVLCRYGSKSISQDPTLQITHQSPKTTL